MGPHVVVLEVLSIYPEKFDDTSRPAALAISIFKSSLLRAV